VTRTNKPPKRCHDAGVERPRQAAKVVTPSAVCAHGTPFWRLTDARFRPSQGTTGATGVTGTTRATPDRHRRRRVPRVIDIGAAAGRQFAAFFTAIVRKSGAHPARSEQPSRRKFVHEDSVRALGRSEQGGRAASVRPPRRSRSSPTARRPRGRFSGVIGASGLCREAPAGARRWSGEHRSNASGSASGDSGDVSAAAALSFGSARVPSDARVQHPTPRLAARFPQGAEFC
jgi:hypothetical protein